MSAGLADLAAGSGTGVFASRFEYIDTDEMHSFRREGPRCWCYYCIDVVVLQAHTIRCLPGLHFRQAWRSVKGSACSDWPVAPGTRLSACNAFNSGNAIFVIVIFTNHLQIEQLPTSAPLANT
jgi:hypothetical protein